MTLTEALRHPFFIALWMSIVTVGVPMLTFILHKKSNNEEMLKKLLDNKVDKDICKSFKTRIGSESDEHRQNIVQMRDDMSSVKEDVAFIRGKMED